MGDRMKTPCEICAGACCESIVIRLPATDAGAWLGLHGDQVAPDRLELATPCRKLGACGSCTIHATRPEHCRAYEVGGADCRATVARRRPADAAEILAAINQLNPAREPINGSAPASVNQHVTPPDVAA